MKILPSSRQQREIARDRASDAYTRRMENGGRE